LIEASTVYDSGGRVETEGCERDGS